VSFIRTGLRELGLKVRRQRTRMALRHVKRQLQRSEIYLGREGTAQAASFPEVRNEIVALKKLEQEQKEVALRITQIEVAVKQIEEERAENTRAQNDAISKLETEKKPILQRRDEAKSAATICERELASVESRLQANDLADRELLKQLSALQAQAPPPADLDTRTAALAGKRARLPQERAEIVRAREGSAEACRQATQKLATAEEELSAAERNITRVRERFEATDRALAEKVRTQQDALRDARAQHQTVEERKNPAYLNIGRHLATRGIMTIGSNLAFSPRKSISRNCENSISLSFRFLSCWQLSSLSFCNPRPNENGCRAKPMPFSP
jgi:chromosome segregation ATPase